MNINLFSLVFFFMRTMGHHTPPPNETSQRIIQLVGDEPGFTGIDGGIESGEI
jgi:hypothetical protein